MNQEICTYFFKTLTTTVPYIICSGFFLLFFASSCVTLKCVKNSRFLAILGAVTGTVVVYFIFDQLRLYPLTSRLVSTVFMPKLSSSGLLVLSSIFTFFIHSIAFGIDLPVIWQISCQIMNYMDFLNIVGMVDITDFVLYVRCEMLANINNMSNYVIAFIRKVDNFKYYQLNCVYNC